MREAIGYVLLEYWRWKQKPVSARVSDGAKGILFVLLPLILLSRAC